MNQRVIILLSAAAVLGAASITQSGCSSTAIAIKEKFGYAKREQLVDRVAEARDAQQDAKKQFSSALEEFLSVTGTGGSPTTSELESKYSRFKDALSRSESKADTVRSRITDTKRVGEALFAEWKQELSQYSSASLKAASQKQLTDTQRQYDKLMGAMNDAAAKMEPVLGAFRDQVLFLKHNLNARAIASLQGTSQEIQTDIAALIKEMESSIAEADAFIAGMKSEG